MTRTLRNILLALAAVILALPSIEAATTLVENVQLAFHGSKAYNSANRTSVSRSDCGEIAAIFAVGESVFQDEISYASFNEAGGGSFHSEVLFQNEIGDADVIHLNDCRPFVLFLDNANWKVRIRRADGSWDQFNGVLESPGSDGGVFALADLTRGADGGVYAAVHWLRFENSAFTFRQLVYRWDGARWIMVTNIGWPAGIVLPYAFQVDRDGRQHFLTSRVSPSHEYSRDLIYIRHHHGETITRLIHLATEIDFFPTNADFSFRADGRIEGVATFVKTVTTGSPVYSRLNYFEEDQNGNFSMRVIVATADGYTGGDGNKYTGFAPILLRDNSGALHLTFQDIANWHNNSGFSRSIPGQWRYGYKRDGSDWTFTTLYRQPGQSQSNNPLHLLRPVGLAMSPGGSHLNFVAMENRQQTAEFPDPGIIDARVLRLRALNSEGTDAKLPRAEIIALLLALPASSGLSPLDFDLSGESLLDTADLRRSQLP